VFDERFDKVELVIEKYVVDLDITQKGMRLKVLNERNLCFW